MGEINGRDSDTIYWNLVNSTDFSKLLKEREENFFGFLLAHLKLCNNKVADLLDLPLTVDQVPDTYSDMVEVIDALQVPYLIFGWNLPTP